jgi:hypothetical protein
MIREKLLDYSTRIPATQTASEIMATLARHGAKSVMVDYDINGSAEALSFQIVTPGEAYLPIRLPINADAVFKVFQEQQIRSDYNNKHQAVRTAWRIAKVWVDAQMAILETKMVTMDEIFLPYLVTKGGRTLYQVIADTKFQLPSGQ